MPIRVSEEGPGYVSTEEPMPPPSPPPPTLQHPQRQANGEGQRRGGIVSQERDHRGKSTLVEEEDDEGEEEEGEIEEGELETASAPPGGGTGGAAGGETRVEYGGDSTGDEEEDGEMTAASPGRDAQVPTPVEAVEAVAGSRTVADADGGGNSESNGGLKGEKEKQQQQRESMFSPPSADKLCPIPSGPRKGIVILGMDCEMVRESAGEDGVPVLVYHCVSLSSRVSLPVCSQSTLVLCGVFVAVTALLQNSGLLLVARAVAAWKGSPDTGFISSTLNAAEQQKKRAPLQVGLPFSAQSPLLLRSVLVVCGMVVSDRVAFSPTCRALVCTEQVYTAEGLELARATVVNVKGQTVYDELVKPT